MKRKIIYMLLFLTSLPSCQKDEDNTTGEIVFYTNAQAMLNCGPFDVNVYLDGDNAGTLSTPYVSDTRPHLQESDGSVLVVEKEPGHYTYSACFSCGDSPHNCDGNIVIVAGQKSYVFLNIDSFQTETNQSTSP